MNLSGRALLKEAAALPFWAFGLFLRPWSHLFWRRLYYLGRLRAQVGWVSAGVQLDGPVTVLGTGRIAFPRRARLGPGVQLETWAEGVIRLGEDVRINRGSVLVAYAEVTVGPETLIGEYVSIRDANHGLAPDRPIRLQPHRAAPVRIGRDVWLGRGVCVLAGVTIGDGAVVGANSVVTRDVPPGAIAAGVPARVLKWRARWASPPPQDRACAPVRSE